MNGCAVVEALDFSGVIDLCRRRPVALDLVDAEAVAIGRDLFDREKWPKIRAVDDRGKQLGVESPLAELKTLKFVLADGFGADLLAKLKATGKSVNELVREATGKTLDKKIADLKKALAEKRRIKAELLRRVAALEAVGSV